MMILHVIPLFSVWLNATACETTVHLLRNTVVTKLCPLGSKTKKSRQPKGMVGYINSKLAANYPLATLSSDIETPRFAERVIGLRQQAGLEI